MIRSINSKQWTNGSVHFSQSIKLSVSQPVYKYVCIYIHNVHIVIYHIYIYIIISYHIISYPMINIIIWWFMLLYIYIFLYIYIYILNGVWYVFMQKASIDLPGGAAEVLPSHGIWGGRKQRCHQPGGRRHWAKNGSTWSTYGGDWAYDIYPLVS